MADEPAEKSDTTSVCHTSPPVTERERELGRHAHVEYDRENYDACLKQMNKILTSRPTDAKVHHNKALAEYCRGGFRQTDAFVRALGDVCEMCQVNLQNVSNLDDVDYCAIYYNYALLLYYTKEYYKALSILDKIFQFIEPLEENLRRRVLFLMVEVYLTTQQPEKAHAIINFTEKNLFGNGTKSQQPTPEKDRDKESRDTPPDTMSANEIWRPKISQYKVRCYLMLKSIKACKREIKTLVSALGLGPQLVYLKSNFEYLRANYRKTIKLLNTSPKPLTDTDRLSVMYYNNLGCIHLNMQKHQLGAFYLKKAMVENDNACAAYAKQYADNGGGTSGLSVTSLRMSRHNELLYNLGIQFLYCNKLVMAFDCLMQVINYYHTNPRLWLRLAECCIKAYKENNDEDRDLSRRLEVVTTSVGSGLHRRLVLGNPANGNRSSKYSEKAWQRNKEADPASQYMKSDAAAVPALTLEFAVLCLKNALLLLPDEKAQPPTQAAASSTTGTADEGEQSKLYDAPIPAPPANPIRGQEIVNLKSSILCDLAYVSLCLNDHLLAAKYAERLLQQPKLSGAHRYVGCMYLAEAYVALDRISDAIYHLVLDNVTDLSLSVPDASKQEQEKSQEQDQSESGLRQENWSPRDLTKARAIMQYNLAMAHAVRGENEKALRNLASSANFIGHPYPAQVYHLMLYMDLVDGQRKRAQNVIREQFGHLTPNRS